jgi:hypothetical protein
MIRQAATAAALLCGLATPSLATEWINCAAPDGAASFDLLVGAVDVLSVVGMTISVGDQVWASDVAYGPGAPVVVGQAYASDETIMIDVVDPAITTRIAELRLFRAFEGDLDPAYGGTLRVPGYGAWAVSCSGP